MLYGNLDSVRNFFCAQITLLVRSISAVPPDDYIVDIV